MRRPISTRTFAAAMVDARMLARFRPPNVSGYVSFGRRDSLLTRILSTLLRVDLA